MSYSYYPTGTKSGRDCSLEREAIAKDPELGLISDEDMATKHGVSRYVASNQRLKCGVLSAWQAGHVKAGKREDPRVKHIIASGLLGKYHDKDVADEYDASRSFIRRIRQNQGLPFNPTPMPNFRYTLINAWKRPKGIDSLLEQIRE